MTEAPLPGTERPGVPRGTPLEPTEPRSRIRPIASFVIAVALLAAAALAISGQSDQLERSLRSAAAAPRWLFIAALALPLANWLIMSVSFWALMRRYGRIGLGEMSCLIGAAWLLNYLPFRPGLLGRVAYHKTVNAIPVRDSIRVSVYSIGCAAVAIGALLVASLAGAAVSARSDVQFFIVGAAPLLAGIVVTLVVRAKGGPWWIALTVLLRYADLVVWAARYAVVFALIDQPISWAAAGAIAAVVQVAMLVPLVGNGLGLREWSVGLMSGVLPSSVVSSGGTMTTTVGLAADLLNRAAEVCCAVPVGLICAAALSRRKALWPND